MLNIDRLVARTGGLIRRSISQDFTAFHALHVDGDGKILAAGNVIAKYNYNGTLDASFATNGSSSLDGVGYGLAVDSEGKIYIVGDNDASNGHASGYDRTIKIWSFLSNGGVNSEFGTTGVAEYNEGLTDANSYARKIVIDSQDRLIVSGHSRRAYFARYLKDGTMDACGGGNCAFISASGDSAGVDANALTLDSSGKVIIGGRGQLKMKLWRLDNP